MTDPHEHPESRAPLADPSAASPEDLWAWIERLERVAEAGLHAHGFVHELSNALTAVMGNCELALLGQTADEIRPDLERVVGQLERVRERLSNFRSYVSGPAEAARQATLRDGLDEAIRFLAYPLRKLNPTIHGAEPVLVDLEEDVLVALSRPKLIHVLASAVHDFIAQARAFHGPLRIAAERRGDRIHVRFTQPEGAEPRRGDEYWQASATGLELPVARGNVARAGGSFDGSAAVGRITIVLPIAKPAQPRDPEAEGGARSDRYEPWSHHRRP